MMAKKQKFSRPDGRRHGNPIPDGARTRSTDKKLPPPTPTEADLAALRAKTAASVLDLGASGPGEHEPPSMSRRPKGDGDRRYPQPDGMTGATGFDP